MQTAADLDPAQLWSRYLAIRDEGAFATLVLAHINLVHAAARRLLPDHPHLADDATQTVFCDLARNADKLPSGVNLAVTRPEKEASRLNPSGILGLS